MSEATAIIIIIITITIFVKIAVAVITAIANSAFILYFARFIISAAAVVLFSYFV